MSVLLIGDTHGDEPAWRRALELAGPGLQLILHTGDVLYHGPRNPIVPGYAPLQLAEAVKACRVPLVIAKGNCDAPIDEQVLEKPLLEPFALACAAGHTVLVTHGDRFASDELAEVAKRHGAEIAVFGHIHLPVLERVAGVWLVNPGSPSLSKHEEAGERVNTVGLLDERGIRLLRLADGGVLAEAAL